VNISTKVSQAALSGQIYNLDHFHKAWNDPSLIRLMGNELVIPPSPKVIAAVQDIAHKLNYYPEDPATNQKLLSALAQYMEIPGGADWIILGNGSMELIDMLPRTFLNPGDEVLLPCPDYAPYSRRPPLYGGKIIDVVPDENFQYCLEDFTDKLSDRTKMIIISRPNAPVGNMLPLKILRELCKLDVILVVDEAYAEFSEQSMVSLLDDYTNVIISRTFSKAMGLGGIRLGFAAAHPEVISYINRVRVPLNISLITQIAALAALEDVPYIVQNTSNVIAAREWFTAAFEQIEEIRAIPSKGNFVLLDTEASGIPAAEFYQQLKAAKILTRNVSGSRGVPGAYYLRVTIGTMKMMKELLSQMKEILSLAD